MKKRRTAKRTAKRPAKRTAKRSTKRPAKRTVKRTRRTTAARAAPKARAPSPQGLGRDEKQMVKLALWASLAVIAIVLLVLFFSSYSLTGNYTYSPPYIQYTPVEICEVNGCVFSGELTQVRQKSPLYAPQVGCWCDGQLEYFYLMQRVN